MSSPRPSMAVQESQRRILAKIRHDRARRAPAAKSFIKPKAPVKKFDPVQRLKGGCAKGLGWPRGRGGPCGGHGHGGPPPIIVNVQMPAPAPAPAPSQPQMAWTTKNVTVFPVPHQ